MRVAESGIEPAFQVRTIPVCRDLILSPMAGFSDMPYRFLCREYGSSMSYTEFVSAEAILHANLGDLQQLKYREQERPVVFQVYGSDVDLLSRAALRVEKLMPDIIDINMGCSVRHVSGRGAGAGLLKEPSRIARIFERLASVLSVPVTGKIRLGWDDQSLNYLDVARVLEDSGAALIAVHGRTKAQAYSGFANWDAIAEIVESVQIPVLGNGDIRTVEDIERMKSHTGCAGVMIGRAAIGHPWIFQRRNRESVRFSEKSALVRRHFELIQEFSGDRLALILIRKHIARYLSGYAGIRDLYSRLVRVESVDEFHSLLDQLTNRLDPEALMEVNPA